MDPLQQLQLMQDMGAASGGVPGFGGFAPLSQTGISNFAAAAQGRADISAQYLMPSANISPLGSAGVFSGLGMMGMFADMAGNAVLGNTFRQAGMLSTGGSNSLMMAIEAHRRFQQQQQILAATSGLDEESYYRSFRGLAAMAGQPFNAEQRRAARSLAGTMASMGPMMAMMAPDLADSMAGERGSAVVLANQLSDFNRYRIDPATGRLGYSAASNTALVENLFNNMFSADNMPNMRGLRAGDVGQLYKEMGYRGLLSPQLSPREATLRAMRAAQAEGVPLAALAQEAGMGRQLPPLTELSDRELEQLRGTSEVQTRLTKTSARDIAQKLQNYTDSLGALREVFGDNGNPNAPVPQLIGALEELTSGQLQKFDPARLNTLVRDMQAISQTTGKSMDQLMLLNRGAAQSGQQLGIGTTFSPEAVNVGASAGQAFIRSGGATGFGAATRDQVEISAMQRFNMGIASEASNAIAVMQRLQDTAGFANNDAGRRLQSIMAAARSGESTYTDPVTGQTRAIPIRESEFRSLINAQGVQDVNTTMFNVMLGQRTTNLRALHDNPQLQQAAFNQQRGEIERNIQLSMQSAFRASVGDPQAAQILSVAASEALLNLTPTEQEDANVRGAVMGNAIRKAARAANVPLTEAQISSLATEAYGQAENQANRFNFSSFTEFSQVQGRTVTEQRQLETERRQIRRDLNIALQGLGPSGGLFQRMVTALQKTGDDPANADLTSFFARTFGATNASGINSRLTPLVARLQEQGAELNDLEARLAAEQDPEARRRLKAELDEKQKRFSLQEIPHYQEALKSLGLSEASDQFNLIDISDANRASAELSRLTRSRNAARLGQLAGVTVGDRAAFMSSQLTAADAPFIAAGMRRSASAEMTARFKALDRPENQELAEEVRKLQGESGLSYEGAVNALQQSKLEAINQTDFASKLNLDAGNFTGRDIDARYYDDVILGRRQLTRDLTAKEIADRASRLPGKDQGLKQQQAEDLLILEQQLRSAGFLAEGSTLENSLGVSPELWDAIKNEKRVVDRGTLAANFLDTQIRQSLRGAGIADAQAAASHMQTAEGKRFIESAKSSFFTLSSTRKNFLLDEEAVKRGGLSSIAAIRQSREAEARLLAGAQKYTGGDIGAYLSYGVAARNAAGAAAIVSDFSGMDSASRKNVRDRLAISYPEYRNKSSEDITVDDYRLMLELDRQQDIAIFGRTPSGMGSSAEYSDRELETMGLLGADVNKLRALEIEKEQGEAVRLFSRASGIAEDSMASLAVTPGTLMDKNLRMISGVLSDIGGKKYESEQATFGRAGLSPIQKLDAITDAWEAAGSISDRKSLAKKYGYTYEGLRDKLARTQSLGLAELDDSRRELSGARLTERLRQVGSVDLLKEAQKEQDKIVQVEGTLVVTGDIVNGKGTFHEATGNPRAR